MWILINSAQFLVFVGLWQISQPAIVRIFFKELKRVVMGEFIDDLDIAKHILEPLGLETNDESTCPEEKVGFKQRLGSTKVKENFGASFIVFTFAFLIIILLVVLMYFLFCKFSKKLKEGGEKLKKKIFYSPIIRYAFLNALKLNFIGMAAFKDKEE